MTDRSSEPKPAKQDVIRSAVAELIALGLVEVETTGAGRGTVTRWTLTRSEEQTTVAQWADAESALCRARCQGAAASVGPVTSSAYTRLVLAADGSGRHLVTQADLVAATVSPAAPPWPPWSASARPDCSPGRRCRPSETASRDGAPRSSTSPSSCSPLRTPL